MGAATQILFIGNSFTNRNDLPGMLEGLGASASPARPIRTRRVIANGAALKTHWDRGTARDEILRTPWDYVVLQEQSTLPLKNRARMHESIRIFDRAIRERGAKTVLYLTWARLHSFDRQDELSDAFTTIGRELEAVVVPAGVAWKRALAERPGLVLHDKDQSHPNAAGTYLAACTFYAALFDETPAGLTTDFPVLQKQEPETLRALQDVAWHTVKEFTLRPPPAPPAPTARSGGSRTPAARTRRA
jgi:hypothetical protein